MTEPASDRELPTRSTDQVDAECMRTIVREDGANYSPRTVTNRTSSKPVRIRDARLNCRSRREYARVLRGMEGYECFLVTLTHGRGLDLLLRAEAWRRLRTRLGQKWPDFAAWSVYEYSHLRGVHMHVIVKDTPGLDEAWIEHVVGLVGDGTAVHIVPINSSRTAYVARYVTKQLSDRRIASGWPRGFRAVSCTRNWCPRWLSRKAWERQS